MMMESVVVHAPSGNGQIAEKMYVLLQIMPMPNTNLPCTLGNVSRVTSIAAAGNAAMNLWFWANSGGALA